MTIEALKSARRYLEVAALNPYRFAIEQGIGYLLPT
jgi:hypothetical protein